MKISEGYSYDDLILIPKYSEITSRSDVDLSVKIPKINVTLKHPIIPSNMKTVTEYEMAKAVYGSGGMALIHRFMKPVEQLDIIKKLEIGNGKHITSYIGLSIGIKDSDKDTVDLFIGNGVKIICIDVAHGDSLMCHNMCKWIAKKYPNVLLIAGNVATGLASANLWRAGADIVRQNVGSGSVCSTRIQTGNGVPSLTNLMDTFNTKKFLQIELNREILFVADGGIKNSGDVVKSCCFADLVMAGNIFAGCDEAPGNVISIDGIKYKEYAGSSTYKTNHVEGVSGLVPYRGSFTSVLSKLLEGLRSGCSYQGAPNLNELKRNPEFVKITGAGLRESHPHDIKIIE